MRISNPTILITGEIDDTLLNETVSKGFVIDVIPFIKTETITTIAVKQAIEKILQLDATIVFTSGNAIEAVKENIQPIKPDWKIYCIGNTTRILVEKLFGKASIIATANNAAELAEKIIANKSDEEVYFFCSDKKRDELPALLQENNIAVNEIEVYTTTILHHIIQKKYDAILFFSPSAVEGFFTKNDIDERTILFAIGNTTANEIKKFSKNEVVINDEPGKKKLLDKTIEYFKSL